MRNNVNEKNADRVNKSLHNLIQIVKNVEKSNQIKEDKGSRKQQNVFDDVKKLSAAYNSASVFESKPARNYESFPKSKQSVLDGINTEKFRKWILSKEEEFKDLYENRI